MNLGSALHQFTEEHHFINPEILRSFLLSSFPVPVSVGLSSVTARELLTDDAGSYTERVDMKQATGGRFRTYMKGFNSENTHGHQNKPDPECSAALSERRQVHSRCRFTCWVARLQEQQRPIQAWARYR